MSQVDIYLVRGLAREAGHWGEFTEILKQQTFVRDVHALDLLGTGIYHKLTAPLRMSENAEFLLRQLPSESKVPRVLLAISLGGMVAMEVCRLRPDAFQKVLVMNSSFSNLSPLHHRLQLQALRRFFGIALAKDLVSREMEVLKMVSQAQEKHPKIATLWAQLAEDRPMRVGNFFRQLLAAASYKMPLEKFKTPVVVLNSAKDEMVAPMCSEALAAHLDQPLYTHPSAGHDICVDDPKWVVDILQKEMTSMFEEP